MSDAIRVNNNQFSWGSIVVRVDGEPFFGFTALSYSDKRERVHAWGMGRHHAPRGRSRGKYTVENAKLTGWKSSVQALRDFLSAKSSDGKSYGDVVFQVVAQYVEFDELPCTVEIVDCVWAANSTSEEESADPLKEEFEIMPMLIRRNGATLFDSSGEGPK